MPFHSCTALSLLYTTVNQNEAALGLGMISDCYIEDGIVKGGHGVFSTLQSNTFH